MAAVVTKLGPGLLKIGDDTIGTDMSCQLSAAWIKFDKDKEDDTEVLCGDTVAGAVTYTGKLSGTVLVDLSTGGLVEFTWTHAGEQFPFLWVPNNPAAKQI